ncbi:FtsK/SpoIIIE domain-containing protein (plasmid) [Mycobacterium sp. TJFP1]
MSTNARKHAARNYQRTHQVSYTEALRAVSQHHNPAVIGRAEQQFLDALAIADPTTFTPQPSWRQHAQDRDLVVPIATSIHEPAMATDPTVLRLNASNSTIALIGKAGSGKSAALKAITLAACARYSSQRVTFALAGANAAVLTDIAELPHITTYCFDRSDGAHPDPCARQWCTYLDQAMDRRTTDPQARLPELVLVIDAIDEFLLDLNPHAAATVQRAFDHGRELGIRIILSATTIHATEASAWIFHAAGLDATVRVTPDTAIALATTSPEHSQLAVGHPDAWTLSPGLGHAYIRQSPRPAEGPIQLLYAGEAALSIAHRTAAYQR